MISLRVVFLMYVILGRAGSFEQKSAWCTLLSWPVLARACACSFLYDFASEYSRSRNSGVILYIYFIGVWLITISILIGAVS